MQTGRGGGRGWSGGLGRGGRTGEGGRQARGGYHLGTQRVRDYGAAEGLWASKKVQDSVSGDGSGAPKKFKFLVSDSEKGELLIISHPPPF